MSTDNREFREILDTIRDYRKGVERRQLDHLPPGAERREATRRRSVVLNSCIRPAGGPNGTFVDEMRTERIDAIMTDEDELAALDRACEDENRALKACCIEAAKEISGERWNGPSEWKITELAAVIYKHMRNGREL